MKIVESKPSITRVGAGRSNPEADELTGTIVAALSKVGDIVELDDADLKPMRNRPGKNGKVSEASVQSTLKSKLNKHDIQLSSRGGTLYAEKVAASK